MNRANNIRFCVIRPRQIGTVFTEKLVAFVAEQPLECRIYVLRRNNRRMPCITNTVNNSRRFLGVNIIIAYKCCDVAAAVFEQVQKIFLQTQKCAPNDRSFFPGAGHKYI